jgi:hypothetical protein
MRLLLRWIVVLALLPKAASAQVAESRGQESPRPVLVSRVNLLMWVLGVLTVVGTGVGTGVGVTVLGGVL